MYLAFLFISQTIFTYQYLHLTWEKAIKKAKKEKFLKGHLAKPA
jgi:hypothetical protein